MVRMNRARIRRVSGASMKLAAISRLGADAFRFVLGGQRRPWAVAWLINDVCTRRCLYCQWSPQHSNPGIGAESAHRLIDQMADAGVAMLSFSGGEPLLRDDIGDLITHASRRGMACKLNSNGDLVPERLSVLTGLEFLQLSLDGPGHINDGFRGQGSAASVEHAILAARSAGIPVRLVGCITAANAARIKDVLLYVSDLGATISFQPLITYAVPPEVRTEVLPDHESLKAAWTSLLDISRDGGPLKKVLANSQSDLEFYLERMKTPFDRCPCPKITATLMPDGTLTFCGIPLEKDIFNAVEMGFEQAFRSLTRPICDGRACCVGKMKIMRIGRTVRSWTNVGDF